VVASWFFLFVAGLVGEEQVPGLIIGGVAVKMFNGCVLATLAAASRNGFHAELADVVVSIN